MQAFYHLLCITTDWLGRTGRDRRLVIQELDLQMSLDSKGLAKHEGKTRCNMFFGVLDKEEFLHRICSYMFQDPCISACG